MPKKLSFNKIVVIYNPASTNARHLKKRMQELKKYFPGKTPITILETSRDGREANRHMLVGNKDLLGPRTLLCIAAGDGTVNLVVETLLTEKSFSKQVRQTPILPLWGGNANDLGHMLNGYSRFVKLRSVLKNAQIVKVKPLNIAVSYRGKSTTRIAACYASFGATAYAAHMINHPSHRKTRLRRFSLVRLALEVRTVIGAFLRVPRFKLAENNAENKVFEYAFINGSRIAKFERMPVNLTDDAFYVIKIKRKHPVAALYVLQILRRRRFGRITSRERTFNVNSPTWLQIDGEVIHVKKGTLISVTLNEEPFYALSQRLRNTA